MVTPRERPVRGTRVDTARRDEPVLEAADRMRQRNVGTLVAVDREDRVVGLLASRRVAEARIEHAAERLRSPEAVAGVGTAGG